MNTCQGCRSHYRKEPYPLFVIDFCGLDGGMVGYECPIGIVETGGCLAYEKPPTWPEGAIA
ncbi:MAG: hypothetical protein WC277_04155 [Bacilli bacterium]